MKALYFTQGAIPTKEEREAAKKLGITAFRNARLAADPSDPIEPCDAVAGAVPDRYAKLKGVKVLDAKAPVTAQTPGGNGKPSQPLAPGGGKPVTGK